MMYATVSSFEFESLKATVQSELEKLAELRGKVLQSSHLLPLMYLIRLPSLPRISSYCLGLQVYIHIQCCRHLFNFYDS